MQATASIGRGAAHAGIKCVEDSQLVLGCNTYMFDEKSVMRCNMAWSFVKPSVSVTVPAARTVSVTVPAARTVSVPHTCTHALTWST
eukprot:350841-Chlamydomonas_euryale.AAC.16